LRKSPCQKLKGPCFLQKNSQWPNQTHRMSIFLGLLVFYIAFPLGTRSKTKKVFFLIGRVFFNRKYVQKKHNNFSTTAFFGWLVFYGKGIQKGAWHWPLFAFCLRGTD
jgi:hypothetical protein